MFQKKKFIVFLVVASIGITFCQAAKEVKLLKDLEDDKDHILKSCWFGIGLLPPAQLPDENTEIKVFRFSAGYTYNRAVTGYDAGVVCYSGNATGLQTAWSNHTDGVMNGLTIGIFNTAKIEMNGMQIGIYNGAGADSEDKIKTKNSSSAGTQWGFANYADSLFSGWQLGVTNVSTTLFKGLQLGVVNIAQESDKVFDEFQSKRYKKGKGKRSCFQVGLINFNPNGFLPVCLLVNF